MSIHTVQITTHDEKYAPPEEVVELSIIGDVAFFTHGVYEEDRENTSVSSKIEFGIKVEDLNNALQAFGYCVSRIKIVGTQ